MKPIDKFELEPGVVVRLYPEPDPDWSWAESSEDQKKIKRGDMEQVIVEVVIYDASGEVEGSDSIGGVVIGIDDHKQEIRDTIDAYDMVQNARNDLKDKLNRIIHGSKAGAQ